MKETHTKADWFYEFNHLSSVSPNGHFMIKAGDVGTPIAMLPMPLGGINTLEKQKANARLISAAPDLLAACEQCVNALEVVSSFGATTPIIARAKQAINKAKLNE